MVLVGAAAGYGGDRSGRSPGVSYAATRRAWRASAQRAPRKAAAPQRRAPEVGPRPPTTVTLAAHPSRLLGSRPFLLFTDWAARLGAPRDMRQQAPMGRRLRHRGRSQGRPRDPGGAYIDRNSITVAAYLDQWLAARITRLYCELATSGGRDGAGLSPRTLEYVHAVLRKAFRDAVMVDQTLPSKPVERAKRPRKARSELGRVWTPAQLWAFLDTARQHRLFAPNRLAAYTGARRAELLNLRCHDIDLDLDLAEIRITDSTAVIAGQHIEGTTKSGLSRTVSIAPDTVEVLKGSPQAPGRGTAESRSRVARRRRLRVRYRLGRADPPRHGVVAHEHAYQHPQRSAGRSSASRPATRSEVCPRHNLAAGWRPGTRGRRQARPC